jgi:hypothetical protein
VGFSTFEKEAKRMGLLLVRSLETLIFRFLVGDEKWEPDLHADPAGDDSSSRGAIFFGFREVKTFRQSHHKNKS